MVRSVDFINTTGITDKLLYQTLYRKIDDQKSKRLIGAKNHANGYTLWEKKRGSKESYRVLCPEESTEWESLQAFKTWIKSHEHGPNQEKNS